eukprot:COSAG02_NODE_7489_length_2989_cov_6.657383_5_plen_206_part_01
MRKPPPLPKQHPSEYPREHPREHPSSVTRLPPLCRWERHGEQQVGVRAAETHRIAPLGRSHPPVHPPPHALHPHEHTHDYTTQNHEVKTLYIAWLIFGQDIQISTRTVASCYSSSRWRGGEVVAECRLVSSVASSRRTALSAAPRVGSCPFAPWTSDCKPGPSLSSADNFRADDAAASLCPSLNNLQGVANGMAGVSACIPANETT